MASDMGLSSFKGNDEIGASGVSYDTVGAQATGAMSGDVKWADSGDGFPTRAPTPSNPQTAIPSGDVLRSPMDK